MLEKIRGIRSRENLVDCLMCGDSTRSAIVDLEIDIYLLPIVELADRLGVALVAVELGVNLVVDIRGERWEAVDAIVANDIGLNRARARIGQVDDRVRERCLLPVQDLAGECAAVIALLVKGTGCGKADQQEHQRYDYGLLHRLSPKPPYDSLLL